MKKFSIFLMMLMGVFLPWAANGQSRSTATFNDGTTTNGNVPIYGLYSDYGCKAQFIIPATDLTSKGVTGGSTISAIKLFCNKNSQSYFGSKAEVQVGEVDYTSFSSKAFATGLTTVASNNGTSNTLTTNSSGELEITFSTSYNYNGGNLVISIGGYGSKYASTNWYGVSSTNASVYGYNSSSSTSIPSSVTSIASFAPKTIITFTASVTPYIGLPASATVITGFTQTLTATYGNVSGTPSINYTSSDNRVATVTGSGTTATVMGVSAGTATITASMTVNGTPYTATCAITVEDPSYCTPNPSSRDGNGITAVTFGTGSDVVNNSNSSGLPSSAPYYADYTSMAGSFEAGETATVSITYTTGYNYGTLIWVDWNKNYTFDDNELVFYGQSSTTSRPSGSHTLNATFTVPANQAKGDYCMRIAGADSYFDSYIGGSASANHDPCFTSSWATCHDYTLRVAGGAYTITCNIPSNGTLSVDKNSADENETVTVTATPETNYVLSALTYTPEGGTAQNINIASTPYTFSMPAANVTVNATFSIIRNLPPYDLTLGIPTGHSITLGWTGVSTNNHHQNFEVYHSTSSTAPSDNLATGYDVVNTNSYLLSGLTPETTYYAWVRDNCGTDGKSAWVAFNAFTTDEACSNPNTITASNLTSSSAHISWNCDADSYNVKYATTTITGTTLQTVYEDGFENGIGNWTTYASAYSSDATNWKQYDATNFSSGGVTNHTGSYVAISRSYDGSVDRSVDNWLISPQMTLGDVVKFWVCGDDADYREYFAVYVSTGTNAIGDFEFVVAPEAAPGDGTWAERIVDLSAYAGQQGYVAIRHTDAEKDFLLVDDFGVYKTINTYSYGTWNTVSPNPSTNSCDITGLSPETLYEVQVQANCDTYGTSGWGIGYFTTPYACSAPTDLVSSNITATSATLAWADNQSSYNVQYRKVYYYESFEAETLPTGWTTIDANGDGNTWSIGHATTHTGNNGAANISFIYNTTGTTPNDYLVSPQLDLQGTLRVWLSGYGTNNAEHFEILLSTTGNSVSDFTTTLVSETTTSNAYVEYTANLSSYAGQKGYIAIHHFNCSDQRYLYVDDFGLYGTEDWVPVSPNPTSGTTNLTGLTPNVGYEWQVQGLNCNAAGSATDWSDVATFTTLAQYQKTIASVSEQIWAEGKGGYYLIASPLAAAVDPTTITDMIPSSGNYDLYSFDQEEENEWCNYKADPKPFTTLANGKGYLYANKAGVTLTFVGPAGTNGTVTLDKTNDNTVDFQGWNLVGNPFGVDAYINKPFYTLENSDTYTENTAGDAIHAMQGLLVVADSDGETLTFSTTAPAKKAAKLNMNVSKGHSVVDHAIISFNEGQQLPKLQFRQNSTKVYMPKEGIDYAIVSAESNVGEMPVNFKAEDNGTYTLNFTTEEVSFAYLHLIDNMTGNDVDLLANPSYSFNAKTTDYESRFKLVFATGNNANDDTFAFYSNGNFIINNEGEATLQLIDINGRILKSESINGCANVNVNAAQGIYMLRLVNGENVKVQKMVVR